jgi:hypothetical protein
VGRAGLTRFKRRPDGPHDHVVLEAVLSLHQLFRATKIAMLHLKSIGMYQKVARANVFYMIGEL